MRRFQSDEDLGSTAATLISTAGPLFFKCITYLHVCCVLLLIFTDRNPKSNPYLFLLVGSSECTKFQRRFCSSSNADGFDRSIDDDYPHHVAKKPYHLHHTSWLPDFSPTNLPLSFARWAVSSLFGFIKFNPFFLLFYAQGHSFHNYWNDLEIRSSKICSIISKWLINLKRSVSLSN